METKSKSNFLLKVLLIVIAVVVFSMAGVIAFILYHLPAGNKLSAAILNQNRKSQAVVSGSTINSENLDVAAPANDINNPPPVIRGQQKQAQTQTMTFDSNAGLRDLMDKDRPLSNFCGSLKNAQMGKMNNAEAGKAFQLSLDEATADPRAQSLKPIFRYIFRMPEFQDLIAAAQAASQNPEEGFTDKAAFYTKAVSAFAALRSHKEDLEAVADRSYLFHKLNAVVAQRPELFNDERLKKFCEDTETSFNQSQPVRFDQEKNNFERLLAELNVDQKSIGYDPNYKTSFDLHLGDGSLRLTGGWIEDVFTK